MNKNELQQAIAFLFEDGIELGFEMYLLLKSDDGLVIKQADLGDEGLANEIKVGFLEYVQGRTIENEEAQVKPLSELNTAATTIHSYDLGDLPEGLEIINEELDSETLETFRFEENELSEIKAFLIKISSVESNVVLYKHHSHLNLITQKNGIFMTSRNERFVKPNDDQGILRFSFTMDFLKIGEDVLVYDLKCLQSNFNFNRILISKAEEQIDEIEALGFIDNVEELRDFVSEKSGAKKVLKLKKDSPVLKMPFNDIKNFVKNDKYLKTRFHF